mgnify:CR=1 FL=1
MSYRVHLLILPNAFTTKDFYLDGFSQLTIRMAKLLKSMGVYVMLYGGDRNEAPCDEFIQCISTEEHQSIGKDWPYQNAMMTAENPLWKIFNPRAIEEIGKRKKAKDFIFTLGGVSQKSIMDAHMDLMDVEYSIGYPGNYCRYRVFESYAWKHICYGGQSIGSERFYDTVIPCFYEEEAFPYYPKGDGYAVYVGRLIPKKGISIACDAAKAAGIPLKVLGHGDEKLVTYGEFLGQIDNAARNELIAHADVMFCPTVYLEPFNQVAVEAQMCGVPVIATDQGGFTETIEDGISGRRCHTLREFRNAVAECRDMDRGFIRIRASAQYGMETARTHYQRYMDRLSTIWEPGGWSNLG